MRFHSKEAPRCFVVHRLFEVIFTYVVAEYFFGFSQFRQQSAGAGEANEACIKKRCAC